MRKGDCQVGQRVIVRMTWDGCPEFAGRTGTIVDTTDKSYIGVEFDDKISSFSPYDGHDCGCTARDGYGFYGSPNEIDLINEPINIDDIKITFDDVLGGENCGI